MSKRALNLVRQLKHLPGQHPQKSHAGSRGGGSSGVLNSPELKADLAVAANKVLADWQPDEEGYDEEFGGGGACDSVCRSMGDVLMDKLPDSAEILEGGQDGDDHAWSIVYDADEGKAWGVDIPPQVYETGGGYSWSKIQGAKVRPNDVTIWEIPGFEPYEDW